MANLNQYLNFSVLMDKSLSVPKFILTDTSDYPTGIKADIMAQYVIMQPDGISVTTSLAPVSELPVIANLRLNSQNNFQRGDYKIKYIVKHFDYDDSESNYEYSLDFRPNQTNINFDVQPFIPQASVIDTTSYSLEEYTVSEINRFWSVKISELNTTISGTGIKIPLIFAGKYYDSRYEATLTATIDYSKTGDGRLTLRDLQNGFRKLDLFAPKCIDTLTEMVNSLNQAPSCGCSKTQEANFTYAFSLLSAFINAGKCNKYQQAYHLLLELYKVLDIDITKHNGEEIKPYSFYCGCGSEVSYGFKVNNKLLIINGNKIIINA
ncbi:hypothetical protein [Polluticaenibacter yanchengensis]|uniref:DUF4249 family protein n=1 Tax=Polluticaenibacter yanchengensis TaxID=3014562 RepID=A0ABT4UIP5_9BACT|nr:hypothetical protein [Chitinophagaceae bacterium LY-5]